LQVPPTNPLAFIQRCVRNRAIFWSYHVNMRLQGRSISRADILDSVDTYEIIESYPQDKYLPSFLVLARSPNDEFHVLFATDVQDDNIRIVTAYRPDSAEWEEGLKTRRVVK
jgi:uncharacterized protein DUF4258